ncbi:MAG: sulfite exporter TauE/SafE family protein [Gammaproteobacteria bacterium]|nr:sulfite exporter TauE/SafE family protein [Gammaproteobacteria bacterium]
MTEISLYLLTGAAAGLSAGLLGIGGGLIIVPILFFIFSQQAVPTEHVMHMALATSLATIIITSVASARAHHQRGAVLWPIVFSLSPGIVIGAWLGAMFASTLASDVLRPVFGIFELMVALYLLVNYKPGTHSSHISGTASFTGGTVIGSLSSIVGIGGGTLTVPFLLWHNIPIRNAVASSAACGFPIAVAGTAAYVVSGWNVSGLTPYALGFVSLPAFALIIVTSIITAPLGASLAHKLPETTLRTVFALVLIALGVKMLWH